MIEYVEIRDPQKRDLIGIVDVVDSIIWQPEYYGVGEFEVYAVASQKNLELLKRGNYVTRIDDINCGIIKNIEIVLDEQKGRMIAASGKFAKTILSQRVIYKPKQYPDGTFAIYRARPVFLKGNVAEACWSLIQDNCGATAPANRQFENFVRGTTNDLPAIIINAKGEATEKQVTYDNLLEYTDTLLHEYEYGAYVKLDVNTGKLHYIMYKGADRSKGNAEGNAPVIFSREYDSLISSAYSENDEVYKTTAFVGGEGEGEERFNTVANDDLTGYNRYELFVDASNTKQALTKSELKFLYPTGTDGGGGMFIIRDPENGWIYTVAMVIIPDDVAETKYTVADLLGFWETGEVNEYGIFEVDGKDYAYPIDGSTFELSPEGYIAVTEKEGKEASYKLQSDIYAQMLENEGLQKLIEHPITKQFTGELELMGGRYTYRKDFDLGDIVTVEDSEIGKEIKCRIIKIKETVSTSGYSITAEYEIV